MSRDPDDGHCKCDHQHDKEQPAFASLFAKRARTARLPGVFAIPFVVERDRNIEPLASFVRPLEELFPLPAAAFLGDPWRFLDHALEIIHFPAQIGFLCRQLLLFLVQRSIA